MKNKKNGLIIMIFVILILLTSLMFFGLGSVEKNIVQIVSFLFIVITEIISMVSVLLLGSLKMNTYAIAGISCTTFIYAVVSLIINILANTLFSTLRGIVVINFIIILLYLLLNVTILAFKKGEN